MAIPTERIEEFAEVLVEHSARIEKKRIMYTCL